MVEFAALLLGLNRIAVYMGWIVLLIFPVQVEWFDSFIIIVSKPNNL